MGEKLGTTAIGLKAEVSDADESTREHVQEETLDKGSGREGEELWLHEIYAHHIQANSIFL